MADTTSARPPVAAALRDHVLDPISTAASLVAEERSEVRAEREAFAQFKQRVAGIDTAATTSRSRRAPVLDSPRRRWDRVRSAFRETVMGVSHYDDVYGESLPEHVAGELTPELAAGVSDGQATAFTPLYKRALVAATGNAIEARERFCATLDDELASLRTHREDLADLVATVDGASVPAWHREEFAARLDDIARSRQETLKSRTPASRTDGHDLSTYLYRDQHWTYPVLTAVARFRRSVA